MCCYQRCNLFSAMNKETSHLSNLKLWPSQDHPHACKQPISSQHPIMRTNQRAPLHHTYIMGCQPLQWSKSSRILGLSHHVMHSRMLCSEWWPQTDLEHVSCNFIRAQGTFGILKTSLHKGFASGHTFWISKSHLYSTLSTTLLEK